MSLRDRWSSLFVHRPSAPPGPSEALPQPWPATKVGPRVMVEHEDPGWRWAASERLTTAVHAQRPDLPVIVELPTSRFDDLEAMAPGCRPVAFPVGPKHLARAVDEAIKERAAGE